MITYRHDIPATSYNNLRVGAGWRSLSLEQAEVGLSNSAFLISAWDEEKPVGVARVISDRGYIYLMAAEGKESFYEQFGFKKRPGEGHMGAGMTKWME